MIRARVERSRRSLRAFAPILAALVLAPMAGLATPGEATASGKATAARSAAVGIGDPASDFTLQSSDGATYTLSDRAGKRNVVLVFFRGTW